jgi:hypothetical protein
MPIYTFFNLLEQKEWTEKMSSSEMEDLLAKNKHIQWVPKPVPTGDSVRLGFRKPDEGFRDLLRTVKKGSPNSSVNTF